MNSAAPSRSSPFVFITGGCRSGKSAYAQALAEKLTPGGLYLAAAHICDEEMRQRALRHQKERGPRWRLHELAPGAAPDLWRQLPILMQPGETLLFDCLTLWVAGCMREDSAPENFSDIRDMLLKTLWDLPCPVIIVNNEVGMGVVPASAAGRTFRDLAGETGQKAAGMATNAILMVSGLPVMLKGDPPLRAAHSISECTVRY
jgi:adenosylcobinamide kinase/adenosylcobinamide-phosphate guanylyltransferase